MPPNTALSSDTPTPARNDSAVVQTPAFSPLYQQIKGLILQSLQAGEWKPGELIPSEIELAGRFKVSQGTVRKAIDELAAENLVTRRQGKGTFVATHNEEQVQYRFLQLHPDIGQQQDEGRAQRNIIECKRIRASADIARTLQLRTGDSVIHVRRILSFNNTPTILEDIWLPSPVFKGLNAEQMAHYPGPPMPCLKWNMGCAWCVQKKKSVPSCPMRSKPNGLTPQRQHQS